VRAGATVVGILALLVLSGGSAGASGDPYRDQAEKITCPTAPSGWFNPPDAAGGRTFLTPLTPIVQPDGPTEFFGAPVVEVDCHYLTSSGKNIAVLVRYALPVDINPWNDFYIGCTVTGHPQNLATGPRPWTDTGRIYRAVGAKTWSLATFIDDLGQIAPGDVARFETIANEMLAAAQPFAHDCGLAGNGGPVGIQSIWTFSFDAHTSSGGVTSVGGTRGSFITTANEPGASVGTISNLAANNFRLRATSHGRRWALALHVGAPIAFQHGYGAVLRAQVAVLASSESGCSKGATGTLMLSEQYLTPPRVAVTVCGHTYLDGKGQVSLQMKTV
jgi:hypothetical protein